MSSRTSLMLCEKNTKGKDTETLNPRSSVGLLSKTEEYKRRLTELNYIESRRRLSKSELKDKELAEKRLGILNGN